MTSRVAIIIPTYNERGNVTRLIDALAPIIAQSRHEINLLVVDAASPDGTADAVRQKQASSPWLGLIVEEKKEGLGVAYAKGMSHAMRELKADYLMEFDADFQHDPRDIPRLIDEIDHGYDYIVGSRYIPGGSIPREWGAKRRFISAAGNLVARIILCLPRLHDITGGFKLARVRGFMDQFDFDRLLSKSFAYKIHLFYYMVRKGAKVKEVPIKFGYRAEGESKIVRNESAETMRVLLMLQWRYLRGQLL